MKRIIVTSAVVAVLLAAVAARAEPVSRQIPFSRKTTIAVPASYSFEFRLWTASSPDDAAGQMVWSEQKRIRLRNKTLRHVLGSVSPFSNEGTGLPPVDFSRQLWVEVARLAGGTYRALPGSRTPLTPSPYALWSETAAAMPAGGVTTPMIADGAVTPGKVGFYRNVLIVAPQGGDFTSPVDAMDSITDSSATNPWLVKIMPGIYDVGTAIVQMKPYVDLEGSGEGVTVIRGSVGSATTPPFFGCVVKIGATDCELRFLTVQNTNDSAYVAAILSLAASRITHVTAMAAGGNTSYGVFNSNADSRLTDVTAAATGAVSAVGVYNRGGDPVMVNVTASASGAGTDNYGVYNSASHPTMTNVVASGEGTEAASLNYGLYGTEISVATLLGGSFTGRGGMKATGICNDGQNSRLDATDVTILAESAATDSIGLDNRSRASATLRGGSVTATWGGAHSRGLHNQGAGSFVSVADVTVWAMSSEGINIGLLNELDAIAVVRGGTLTGSNGTYAYGILNQGDATYLKVERATMAAVSGATSNRGLTCGTGAEADVTQSVLEGASNSVITVAGGGPVRLSNSRLVGGVAAGNVTCTGVSRGTTFNAGGCP